MQGRDGSIRLLPALPEEFAEGSVRGVRLRGGLELSMKWKNQKVTDWKLVRVAGEASEFAIEVNHQIEKKTV